MNISPWKPIVREGRLKEAPEWLDDLIRPLNQHLTSLTNAVIRGGNESVLEVEVVSGQPIELSTRDVVGPCSEVRVAQVADGTAVVGLSWTLIEEGLISVTVFFQGSPTDRKSVRIVIQGTR